MRVIPDLKQMIVNAQKNDVKLQEIVQLVSTRDKTDNAIYENGSFWYRGIVPSSLHSGKISRTKFILRGGGGGGGRIVTPRNIP